MTGSEIDHATVAAPLCLGCAQRAARDLSSTTGLPYRTEPIPYEAGAKAAECGCCAYRVPLGWRAAAEPTSATAVVLPAG